MRKTEHEATKAALFKALDRDRVTATMAREMFGIGHATYDRWRAEWKKRKAQAAGLKRALDALMEAP